MTAKHLIVGGKTENHGQTLSSVILLIASTLSSFGIEHEIDSHRARKMVLIARNQISYLVGMYGERYRVVFVSDGSSRSM